MDFGTGGVPLWVPFVLEYRGNRTRSPEGRLSLEIKLFRPVDQMALYQEEDDTVYRWRDDNLQTWIEDPDYGDQIRRMNPELLRIMRLLKEHSRGYRNFFFDGVEVTDPVELFLRLPRAPKGDFLQQLVDFLGEVNEVEPDGPKEAQDWLEEYQVRLRDMLNQPREKGIIQEIREAIEATIGLTGDELKNLVCSFAGNTSETSTAPMDEPTALDAPADVTPAEPVGTSPERETIAS
jgi:hypothetical protein